jgi:hypothetical protein
MTRLSALVRLRDEEVWCHHSLESIVEWVDEVVIVLNQPADATPQIVAKFAAEHPDKTKVYEHDYKTWEMGPRHAQIPATDPRSSAALYNFTASKATGTHHLKWDGDMVAMDWLGAEIRRLLGEGRDRIRFEGRDIVGDALTHIGVHPLCRTTGIYRAGPGVRYEQGPVTQNLKGVPDADDAFDHRPAFLHFKWARKPLESATCQWPADWQSIPHFQTIAARRIPVARYEGEYPSSVRALL